MLQTMLRPACRLRQKTAGIVALLALGATCATAHSAIVFDPLLPGQYAPGTGADATFLRIDDAWKGTSVYWTQHHGSAPSQYSNSPGEGFALIGTYGWGTGIWGLNDWNVINAPASTLPIQSWSGRVATIDHGDSEYAGAGYAGWGAVGQLPEALFTGATGPQDNWTSHYTGYLRITDPGAYNFGVLYDDGFFLRIWGADDWIQISSDFLSPRERLGFGEDLLLGAGLYRFELGAYDRLEAGVVNLAWSQGGGDWQTVPTEYLVTEPLLVPEPSAASLLLLAIPALVAFRTKRGSWRHQQKSLSTHRVPDRHAGQA